MSKPNMTAAARASSSTRDGDALPTCSIGSPGRFSMTLVSKSASSSTCANSEWSAPSAASAEAVWRPLGSNSCARAAMLCATRRSRGDCNEMDAVPAIYAMHRSK
eukprot:6203010-Pleurochrysis_carterae.AAC.3